MSATQAIQFLKSIQYPEIFYSEIAHAIEGHSFSAHLEVHSLEAKIVQDADRLDGLGAIGIARCFATAGLLKRAFYQDEDPFCNSRPPDDSQFTVDHFFQKLFKIAASLKTETGRKEGQIRLSVMQHYLDALKAEVD